MNFNYMWMQYIFHTNGYCLNDVVDFNTQSLNTDEHCCTALLSKCSFLFCLFVNERISNNIRQQFKASNTPISKENDKVKSIILILVIFILISQSKQKMKADQDNNSLIWWLICTL
jgi:hypothetical protein